MLRQVLAASGWPREIGVVHRDAVSIGSSTISTSFNADNRSGVVDVTIVGSDLIECVDEALQQMRRAGAEYAQVRIDMDSPSFPVVGAGLVELGLSYASYMPGFRPAVAGQSGDVLVLQWIAEVEADIADFVFATDEVRELVTDVVEQAHYAGARVGVRQRRAAKRAQLFAALD
jgi:hypothetical protein